MHAAIHSVLTLMIDVGHYHKQEYSALQIRVRWIYKQVSFLYGERETEPVCIIVVYEIVL